MAEQTLHSLPHAGKEKEIVQAEIFLFLAGKITATQPTWWGVQIHRQIASVMFVY